ncbi:acyl carrier protein [Streptomyces sp. V2I9]|uniref:acyl carrier protein n=1 Tax=unclassified Streptomyces TaxID=2593676 RepID=UPI002781AA0D|nr:acyl carrier protein [Streptomyces sp. V2I9]MDQ0987713.1 acyl carrier protein [Streptomyces sp. V2I9]
MPVSIPEGVHELQKLLIDWVGEFVENPDVSPEDNFLDLGGHSLLAMNLNTLVQERFGHELDVKILFEDSLGSAIAELYERIAGQPAA